MKTKNKTLEEDCKLTASDLQKIIEFYKVLKEIKNEIASKNQFTY